MGSHAKLAVSRARIKDLLEAGDGWHAIAEKLGINPGLAFMIGTGVPADGSGTPELEDRAGVNKLASPQQLVNSKGQNPLRNERVMNWIAERAQRELKQ